MLVSDVSNLQIRIGFGIGCFKRFSYPWDLEIRKAEQYRVLCSTLIVPGCLYTEGEVCSKFPIWRETLQNLALYWVWDSPGL